MLGCQVKTSKGRPCGGAATWTLPIADKWLLHCDDHASRHPSGPRHEDPTETPVSLGSLIKHCEKYLPDAMLKTDFRDCVLPFAETGADSEALERYYLMRVRHPSFNAGSWTDNNHSYIIERFWKSLSKEQGPKTSPAVPVVVPCEHCETPMEQPKRGRRRRFCSVGCKQDAYRGRSVTK